ncbi:MAG: sulfate ABC transporter permease subunit CysT [Planctomycetes bacterium]|nr:sulfate ABC transporter permease subunit CysT [Planctomycetota bacterium]
MNRRKFRSPLPGFTSTLSVTMFWLFGWLVLPLVACVLKAATLSPSQFFAAAWSSRARSAYWLTFGASATAAFVSVLFGLLIAWVLVRYSFPGRRVVDAMIDLPFALPTAVAGLVYSTLYVQSGWYGQFLVPLGIQGYNTFLAIVLMLVFLGLPFVVRTVQPVLESLEGDIEEAAASLGASRWQTFQQVLLPSLLPGMITGFALAFARGLGEYGSIVFVMGNIPFKSEIAPALIVAQLDDYRYAEATSIAVMLLIGSFTSLGLINWLEARNRRYAS